MKNGFVVLVVLLVLTLPSPFLLSQQPSRPSDVLGLALVGHHVSDLDRSIKFFEAIDFTNMDRLGKQAGFNHYATTVVDPQKAQDFYVKVLGGDYPPLEGKAVLIRDSDAGVYIMLWQPPR